MRSTMLVSAALAAMVGIPGLAAAQDARNYYEEGGAIPHYAGTSAPTAAGQDRAYEEGGPIRAYTADTVPATAIGQASGDYLVTSMIGDTVKDRSGRQIGEVQDLVMSTDGRIDGVVVAIDNALGFGAKRVGVDVRDVQPAGNRTLVTSITPEQLSTASDFSQQPTLLR